MKPTATFLHSLTAAALLSSTASAAPTPTITRLTAPIGPTTGQPSVPGLGAAMAASDKWLAFGTRQDPASTGGSVLLYNAVTGAFVKKLIAPDTLPGDDFGMSVAIVDDNIIVGAPGRDFNVTSNQGQLYVISAVTGKVLRTMTYGSLGPPAGTGIGTTLAAEGDYVVTGCPDYDGGKGTAFLFKLSDGAKLDTLSIGAAGDGYGFSVAISGRRIIVGAPFEDNGMVVDEGRVYTYNIETDYLIRPTASFRAWDIKQVGRFGYSVALEGTHALIGSPTASSGKGGACVMDITGVNQLVSSLELPAAAATINGEAMGQAVAFYHGLALVSASSADTYTGRVLAFDRSQATYGTSSYLYDIPVAGATRYDEVGWRLTTSNHALLIAIAGAQADRTAVAVVRNLATPLFGNIIASSGDAAPGIVGASYASFTSATNNHTDGSANFVATVKPGLGSPKGTGKGVWGSFQGQRYLGAATGIPTNGSPLPGDTIADIGPIMQPHTNFAFHRATLKGPSYPTPTGNQIFGAANYYTRDAFGPGTEVTSAPFISPSYDDSYKRAAFLSQLRLGGSANVTAANDTGVQIMNGQAYGYMKAVREGETVGADTLGQLDRVTFHRRSALIHAAVPGAVGEGLFAWDFDTNTTTAVLKRGAATGIGATTYSAFLSETQDNWTPGITLVRASIYARLEPQLKQALVRSNSAGGAFSRVWASSYFGHEDKLLGYWPSWSGSTLIHSTEKGTGITASNDGVLALYNSDNSTSTLLREGQTAPGCHGAKIGSILRVQVDKYGQHYAALATLIGAPKGMDLALFGGSLFRAMPGDPSADLMLQKGTLVDNGLYGIATVTSISFTEASTDKGGAGNRGITSVGTTNSIRAKVAAVAVIGFSDGSTKVVRVGR
ncbi:MAG: FG-GAP repeat protein [Verrucomicrobia bacterium]|nr:FG-GAP repeat protein [Verrucomicrobiota bacterium]